MSEGGATFGEVEASLTGGTVFDLGIAEEYIEHTAVSYRAITPGDDSWPAMVWGPHVTVYMPDSSGLTNSESWWDEEHEGGREEVLELARVWTRETYAKNQLRLAIAAKWKRDNPQGYVVGKTYQLMPTPDPKNYEWPQK